ncbi:VIT family-domain-containing protein [Cercophora scortea]|uniref:VIT family-domain-containing protein n=1 Tax=Cercophora scortea TaxID=314031 RepID=A0AAE0IUX3_9PEZI|nr:VIT family-domain-containing protein [Cercophora scortea]
MFVIRKILPSLNQGRPAASESTPSLPLYSRVASNDLSVPLGEHHELGHNEIGAITTSDTSPTETDGMPLASLSAAEKQPSSSATPSTSILPPLHLTRFLADFTLGFADGLTVPFALTAALSWLGETETVIYAGMGEISAGAFSMGIGGYLSARGKWNAVAAAAAHMEPREAPRPGSAEEGEQAAFLQQEEGAVDAAVREYIARLDLPPDLAEQVTAHVAQNPKIGLLLSSHASTLAAAAIVPRSPIMAGLSVASGYLLGGLLPLFPYFSVIDVKDGLVSSFVVCILAMFVFGFVKDFLQNRESRMQKLEGRWEKRRDSKFKMSWKDVRRSSWEGLQMAVLGSLAAGAAVLCIMFLNRTRGD